MKLIGEMVVGLGQAGIVYWKEVRKPAAGPGGGGPIKGINR
jgi:hypothetical protein